MSINQIQKILIGWHREKLGNVSDIFSGGTPDTNNQDFWGGKINWITPTEITKTGKYITLETEKKITDLGLKNSSAKLLPKGSLVVCTRATVGECSISTYPIATNQGFKNFIPKKDTTVEYLYYFIKSIKSELLKLGSGSTFLEVSKGDIEKIPINLPPLPEQNRIVSVLETWDQSIEKLTKKIEIKKQIKKGLMQDLLTGKKRLSGFTDKWETVRLGDVADFVNGYTFKSSTYREDGIYKVITIANVQDGFMVADEPKLISVLPPNISDEQVLKNGDILISMTGNVGRVCLVSYENCLLNQRVGKIIAKNINRDLLYLFMHDRRFLNRMIGSAQGGAQGNLSTGDIKEYNFDMPKSAKEQSAIANILSTADSEVFELEKKLSIIKDQKKYLLNNLITGAIRTPEEIKNNSN
jgi:type I restriction enzyme S subunit